jgi:hypothetical protein
MELERVPKADEYNVRYKIPEYPDFLIGYSTIPGTYKLVVSCV